MATCRHPLRGFARVDSRRGPRVRGLTRGYMPSPASRVRALDSDGSTGSRTHPWLHAVTRFAGSRSRLRLRPRVRGLTRGYMPSPASRVRVATPDCTTGSRTHPWLHAVTRFAGSRRDSGLHHGFADSPVATCRHPLRGFASRLSRLRHGFADSPVATCRHPLRGFASRSLATCTTGSRTHPWLHAVTRFAGSRRDSRRLPRVRGLTRGYTPSPASRVRADVHDAKLHMPSGLVLYCCVLRRDRRSVKTPGALGASGNR